LIAIDVTLAIYYFSVTNTAFWQICHTLAVTISGMDVIQVLAQAYRPKAVSIDCKQAYRQCDNG
jgi:hypothetical protein